MKQFDCEVRLGVTFKNFNEKQDLETLPKTITVHYYIRFFIIIYVKQ